MAVGTQDSRSVFGPGETIVEHRARVLKMQAEDDAQRQLALSEQTSTRFTPSQRIKIWERLHSTRLPSVINHPLLDAVALQTGLMREQVVEEQKRRATVVAAK